MIQNFLLIPRKECMEMEYVQKSAFYSGLTQRTISSEQQDAQCKLEKSQKASFPGIKSRTQEKIIVVNLPPLQYLPHDDKIKLHEDKNVSRLV